MFQPLKDGKAAGNFIVFADGFAGAIKEPGQSAFRPTGLTVGPDGALYISDDKHGRIWRVTYHGAPDAPIAAAPTPMTTLLSSGEPGPPEGIHPDAGRPIPASCPFRPAPRKKQVALGDRIFHGEARAALAPAATARTRTVGPQAPSLVNGHWLIGDGSLKSITRQRSPTACRSRTITRCRCRRKAARRCRIPTSPPSPLMSGRSAKRMARKVAARKDGR